MVQRPTHSSPISSPFRWKAVMAFCVLPSLFFAGCASEPIWQLGQFHSSRQAGYAKKTFPAMPSNQSICPQKRLRLHPIRGRSLGPCGAGCSWRVFLTAEQVRCQAAISAVLGQLTEIERGLAAEFYSGNPCLPANMKALQQELLVLRTAKHGNTPPRLRPWKRFINWPRPNEQQVLLRKSLDEIETIQANYQELKKRQLPVELDPGVLDRQKLANQEQRQLCKRGWTKAGPSCACC